MTDSKQSDLYDQIEIQEWLDAFNGVLKFENTKQAELIINALTSHAKKYGIDVSNQINTPYINSISKSEEQPYPGDMSLEHKIRSFIRWNAMTMVVKANKTTSVGGHIASYASSANLYEVGFNHFFKGPENPDGPDMLFIQGHSAPGIYARAFLEGRLTESQLDNFRQEVNGDGLSSYPHPWLMSNFWQFPTVSMGLGPLMAIYQARFLKYTEARGLAKTSGRKVWAFLGDGEMDEPESRGAIHLASREKLNNLIYVVNCNLQRLDGPVRGNGKIIQELEAEFKGAGWKVIKLIWGSSWDKLLAKDASGKLVQLMNEVLDGEYQNYKAKDGAFVRENFFGKYPETKALVADMTDEEIFQLHRGGHSTSKIYNAFLNATQSTHQPVIILAKTIKGYGMGPYGEAANTTHQQKKLDINGLKYFRDRFNIPLSDKDLEDGVPFCKFNADHPAMEYIQAKRQKLGGYLPTRVAKAKALEIPKLDFLQPLLDGSGAKTMSTTMAFVRILTLFLRDKELGKRFVPIIPDEARTFGMEGLFRQLGIYDPSGQLYTPVDSNQVMWYKESSTGQVLEEGINEAGATASWIAAATSYANTGQALIPFYIFYSMFGFQRVGDLVWAAGDSRARGFFIGATAGRTTLEGEGLQHQDGHNLLFFDTVPNCKSYDPTFSYELAVIIHKGMVEMYQDQQDVFYYITAMNENYTHPKMPKGAAEGITKGIYKLQTVAKPNKLHVQLMGSGTILREAIKAAELLEKDWGISSDIWSVTSFNMLKRDINDILRQNKINKTKNKPYLTQVLEKHASNNKVKNIPIIAATDYIRDYSDKVRQAIPSYMPYHVLGTDGFGRSDTREKLRSYFEVDSYNIALESIYALYLQEKINASVLDKAIKKYKIKFKPTNPWLS